MDGPNTNHNAAAEASCTRSARDLPPWPAPTSSRSELGSREEEGGGSATAPTCSCSVPSLCSLCRPCSVSLRSSSPPSLEQATFLTRAHAQHATRVHTPNASDAQSFMRLSFVEGRGLSQRKELVGQVGGSGVISLIARASCVRGAQARRVGWGGGGDGWGFHRSGGAGRSVVQASTLPPPTILAGLTLPAGL